MAALGFKVATSPMFWADVELEMVDENGKKLLGKVKLKFVRMTREALREFTRECGDEKLGADALLKVVRDWKGAQNDDGEMAFSPENFEWFGDNVPGFYLRSARKFFSVSSGTFAEERAGN